MSKSGSILYIKIVFSSFINSDQKILEKYFNVKAFLVNRSKNNKLVFLFRQMVLVLFILRNIRNAKVLVIWFADYEAAVMVFLGKIFRKPTVIFAGGQETICYEELRKGVYHKKIRGAFVKYALRNASLVILNHKSLLYHENYYYNSDKPHIDGIKHYIPDIKSSFVVVPNGIDDERILRNPNIQKQDNLILTVGTMNQTGDFYNKGFDLFIEVARRNPGLEFVLIKIKEPFLDWTESKYKISQIPNLHVISDFCSDETLSGYYNKAKVYVQASITEGMPVSLSEAMLCECIPVGSNVNGIPDAIGSTGVIISRRDPAELEQAIKRALIMDTGRNAREFTMQNFSLALREKNLIEIFDTLFQNS